MIYNHALVSGGAGFIGSHLVDALLKRGMCVTSFDNYLTGKKENLNDARLSMNFYEVVKDVREITVADLHGIDIIFHQAASKKTVCLSNPQKDLSINAGGTLRLIMAAKEANVRKFIHASTGSVYGELVCETQDERHPLNPVSYYGISKLAGEQYVRLVDKNATVLRYFHVYGPRQDFSQFGGVVSIFANCMIHGLSPIIYGNGFQERSFTYVQDVVNANLFLMENDYPGIFNVASGENYNLLTLIEYLNGILGMSLEPKFAPAVAGDIKYFNVSNEKLRSKGFAFQMDFKTGLRRTVEEMYGSLEK